MTDKSLQKRAMRKAVERVDIGVFGAPLRLLTWMRKKKASWSGWAVVTAAQSAVGVLLALLVGLAIGVPLNAFSIAVLVGFALGSAIGGPLSFLVWTALLLPITGLLAGLIGDAWVASPSWWRDQAAGWGRGDAIAGWLMIGVPAWMLFWVAASRGVSKVAEMMFEKFALRLGFGAASKFSGEDKRVYDEAFQQSDVSQAETATLLESSGDGTHSVITGEPSKMGGVMPTTMREMGGDPDVSSVPLPSTNSDGGIDYDSFLDTGSDDPDVMKAVGRKATGLESLSDDASPSGPTDAEADVPTGVMIEMEPPNLPDVPRDTSPPLQRVEAPKIDPRQNRALFRRMSQLNLAFQTARREDRDAEFIEKHQDELARISDEQRMILDSMNDTAPLVALIHQIQRHRTEDFLVGRAPADVAPGTGSLDAIPPGDDDVPFDVPVVAVQDVATPQAVSVVSPSDDADGETVEEGASSHIPTDASDDDMSVEIPEPLPAQGRHRDIAAMAASFSQILSPRRTTEEADVDSSGDLAGLDYEPRPGTTVAEDAALPAEDAALPAAEAESTSDTVDAAADPSVTQASEPATGMVDVEPPAAVADPVQEGRTDTIGEVVQTPVVDIAKRSDGASEEQDVPAPPAFEFEFDLVPDVKPAEATVAETEDTNAKPDAASGPEEEMSNRVFNRSVCRQVLGLVVGPLEPRAKADDVVDFERNNADVSVSEVLNSRSFDEHVGQQDAASARHAWREVKQVLSESSNDRLVSEFTRVNARGQVLVEEPHTLNRAAYHALKTESSRLQRLVTSSGDDDALRSTADLIDRNMAILDTLEATLKTREDAAERQASSGPAGVVRQKVAPGRDAVASRGRSIVGSVLGGARNVGTGIMRDAPPRPAAEAPAPASEQVVDVVPKLVEETVTPPVAEAAVAKAPRPGEEGFVSSHPVDSIDYQVEMDMHAAGVASRQRVEGAARDRADEEERERKEAEDRRVREADEQAQRDRQARQDEEDRERARSEEETRRQREADEQDAARRRQEADEVARIEREGAEAERRRKEAEAETAELALARERAASERSRQDDAVMKQFRDRRRDVEVPERFRGEGIMTHVLALSELKNVRMVFQKSGIGSNIAGVPDFEIAMSNPATRTLLQVEAEMVREAAGILTFIASAVDAPDPEDTEAVKALLEESEIPFFQRIVGQVDRGRAAARTLERVAEADRAIREQAEKASGVENLTSALNDTRSEVERLQAEQEAGAAALREAQQRAEAAERERVEAEQRLESIRKEMAGIVDDDFQKALEANGGRVETGGIDGFFSFLSPDETSMVMVMTTPANVFPDGLVQRGSKSMPFSDFLDFAVTRSKAFHTDNVAVFYTDPQIRAYTAGAEGLTLKQIRRSVNDLKEMLNNYGISISAQGE
jgi:colicin import membrane protein